MPNLSKSEEQAWRGFVDSHAQITGKMEETLEESGLSLSEYNTLALADEAGQYGIAMSSVASRLAMSCSGFTRLAKRMERAGYIRSNCCPSDGRVSLLTITTSGQQALREARSAHLADVHKLFLDRLSRDEIDQLVSLWQKLNR